MELHELTEKLNSISREPVEEDLKDPRWYFFVKVPSQLKNQIDEIIYRGKLGKWLEPLTSGTTDSGKNWVVYMINKHHKVDPGKLEDILRKEVGAVQGDETGYAGPMEVDEFPGHKAAQLESEITQTIHGISEAKKNVVKVKAPRATFYHNGEAVGGILSPSKTISPEHMKKRAQKWYDKTFKAKYGPAEVVAEEEQINEAKAYKQILTRFIGVKNGYYVFKDKKGDPFYLEPMLVGDFKKHLTPGMKVKLAYTQLTPGYANYAVTGVVYEAKVNETKLDKFGKKLVKLVEGGNEGDIIASIIEKHPEAWREFQEEGSFGSDAKSDAFYEDLFTYYMESGEMPYGVMKARTGDPYEWIAQRLNNLTDHKLTGDEGPSGFESDVEEDVGTIPPSSSVAKPNQPSLSPAATVKKVPGAQQDKEEIYANNLEQVLGKKLNQASPAEIKGAAPKAKAMMGEDADVERMISLAGINKKG